MSLETDQALDLAHGGDWRDDRQPVIVYLDIETTSSGEWLLSQVSHLDPVDASIWAAEHAADHALDPLHGRVVCYAIATSLGTEWVRSGAIELELLGRLLLDLQRCQPVQIVAHGGSTFDYPFLRSRALSHGGPLDVLAQWLWASKPWDSRLVDTCTAPEWLPAPPREKRDRWPRSLSALAELLGIPRTPSIPSADVPREWYIGHAEAVEAHCLDDVRTLRAVHRRLAAGRGGQ